MKKVRISLGDIITVNGLSPGLLLSSVKSQHATKVDVRQTTTFFVFLLNWNRFHTCFCTICCPPLPPLQRVQIPGSCERTLLQHFHFPYSPKNVLVTQETAFEKEGVQRFANYYKASPLMKCDSIRKDLKLFGC